MQPAGPAPQPGQPLQIYDRYLEAQLAWADYAWENPDHPLVDGELYDNIFYCAQELLLVEDFETHELIPLRFKTIQRELLCRLLRRFLAGEPVRANVLKARREGVSTAIQALYFWLAMWRRRIKALTIAHDDTTSPYLFGMSETFYENLPSQYRPQRHTTKAGKELTFDNPARDPDAKAKNPGLGCSLRTITLKNQGAGQGVRYLHLSEVALWEDNAGKKAMQTVLKSVPTASLTIVVRESTARGVGGLFHQSWVRSEEGITDYEPIFFGWDKEPTYRMRVPEGFVRKVEEEELAALYGLSDEQLMWRRWAIENLCDGDLDNFHQEYPIEPNEAFLASGRQYFPAAQVQAYKKQADQITPPWTGHLTELPEIDGDTNSGRGWIVPEQSDRGYTLRIWTQPEETEDYLIFGDASGGKQDAEILRADGKRVKTRGDWHAAYVFKRSTLEVVAAWHGKIDRDEYGDHLYRLGKYYAGCTKHLARKAGALVAVEISGGWGQVPISRLKWRGYPRIYIRPTQEDVLSRDQSDLLGWDTNIKTRPLMLDEAKRALRERLVVCHDPYLFSECLTFVYGDDGKPQAQPGCFDDRVMAFAGGCYLWSTAPRRRLPDPNQPKYTPPSYARPRRQLARAS